tara:strand:+ start:27880 stop:28320 length:441 start_codon:yes stop_codon:yes gene_type:complete
MIDIKIINTSHELYFQEQELRNKVLLRPIGLEDHAWEMHDNKSFHFVAVENGKVVGCVVLFPLSETDNQAQLLQMAVETNQQGKGIGKLLIKGLIKFAKENAIKDVVCHARDNAVPFYQSLNFEIYDEPFVEVGMQHYHMRISLTN